jgi:hypothetical protein
LIERCKGFFYVSACRRSFLARFAASSAPSRTLIRERDRVRALERVTHRRDGGQIRGGIVSENLRGCRVRDRVGELERLDFVHSDSLAEKGNARPSLTKLD